MLDGDAARIRYTNTTGGPVDFWGQVASDVLPPGDVRHLVDSDTNAAATVAFGSGNDPDPRRTISVTAFAFQDDNFLPCGFQAEGTLWTSE